ncbi:kynurenine formamidase [Paenibacillus castaneae]|uniref:cyclase family protein n=1 Tax=Paenibacillus castaneae TaxID=474957 RepID=UPI000C9B35AA|nr:cyclase family protein [Paenibacillus castaneae]NIK78706.1 kynurenine formamidase [Paenibacillus castaneae]
MKVYDLTGPIECGMWGYGEPFPKVAIDPIATVDKDGFSSHRFLFHSLAGTYIENRNHLFAGTETIDQLPVDRFIKKAWVAQLEEKEPLESVSAAELEAAIGSVLESGDALLVSTGWDKNWNKPGYVEQNPYFLPDAMDWIVQRKVSILGTDLTHIQDPRNDDGSLLRHFYEHDGLLIAPVVNLRKVAGKGPFTLISLPLLIPGVNSTPSRAVLIENM